MNSLPQKHTVAFIKRAAKKIKKQLGVQHHVALDLASQQAGFANWKHFIGQNESVASPPPKAKSAPSLATKSVTMRFVGKVVRPNALMPQEAHLRLGKLLEEVIAFSQSRKSVTTPLDRVRCKLDNWVQIEYPGAAMPSEVFQQMYYGNHFKFQSKRAINSDDALRLTECLQKAKEIILNHYPECKPVDDLLAKIDRSMSAVEKWLNPVSLNTKTFSSLKRGSIVRIKPLKVIAVVLEHDLATDTVRFYGDAGPGLCARHEVTLVKSQKRQAVKPMRPFLPYGTWTKKDGSQVLFNRDYKPLWQKDAMGEVTAAEPDLRVKYDHQEWFFKDGNPPWTNKSTFEKCLSVLRDWGVEGKAPKVLTSYQKSSS